MNDLEMQWRLRDMEQNPDCWHRLPVPFGETVWYVQAVLENWYSIKGPLGRVIGNTVHSGKLAGVTVRPNGAVLYDIRMETGACIGKDAQVVFPTEAEAWRYVDQLKARARR